MTSSKPMSTAWIADYEATALLARATNEARTYDAVKAEDKREADEEGCWARGRGTHVVEVASGTYMTVGLSITRPIVTET